jgi:AraC-like DNA-binding protein
MDALTHILQTIQLSANPYVCRAGDGPWSIQYQYRTQGIFHIILSGECYLDEGGNSELIHLRTGDGVAFPTGGAHWIYDQPENQHLSPVNVLNLNKDEGLMVLKTGDVSASANDQVFWQESDKNSQDNQTIILSGTLSYDTAIKHPFLKSLPCFIHVNDRGSDDIDKLKVLCDLMVSESSGDYPGKPLMINHLTEILFVQMLRVHMHRNQKANGYLAALSDPQIGIALNLIHQESNQKLTIESLCGSSALGRTAFTKKFVDMVGMTPKAYLLEARLIEARTKLQSTNQPTIQIAEASGYASEAAFSKAFKKQFNLTPGQVRKG